MSLYILISDSLDYTKYSRTRVNTRCPGTTGGGEREKVNDRCNNNVGESTIIILQVSDKHKKNLKLPRIKEATIKGIHIHVSCMYTRTHTHTHRQTAY